MPVLNRPSSLLILSLTVFLGLGACAPAPPETAAPAPIDTPLASDPSAPAPDSTPSASDHSVPRQGGQVVEMGPYHLEFVAAPEGENLHFDLYLQQGDDHTAIPDAQVTAVVELPNGNPQSLPMDYDPEGSHYVALLPGAPAGDYSVAILTEIQGEKVNARFSFTKG